MANPVMDDKGAMRRPRFEAPSSVPSRMDTSAPAVMRTIGMFGVAMALTAILVWLLNAYTDPPRLGSLTVFGLFKLPIAPTFLGMGLLLMFAHAVSDREIGTRRLYGMLGYAAFVLGLSLFSMKLGMRLGATEIVATVIAAVVGLLVVAATAFPFVRDPNSGEAAGATETSPPLTLGNFLPRWLGSFSTNKMVQTATLAALVFVVAGVAGGYLIKTVDYFPYGLLALTIGAAFLFTYAKQEEELAWRDAAICVIGLVGSLAAIFGLATVALDLLKLPDWALPYGLMVGFMGLIGLWLYVILQGSDTDLGHTTAWGMVFVGLGMIVVAAVRSATQEGYGVPVGYLYLMLGAAYAGIGLAFATDNKLVVLTRRELTVVFYSPIAYFVLGSITLVAWMSFYLWTDSLGPVGMGGQPPKVQEPIIRYYFFDIFPVIFLIICVPSLTMRLLSEEKSSGTIEVLLTAPVDEITVVLSKFLGSWIFFMLVWSIWAFFPMTLRVFANETFDYRPLLSFFVGMTFMSAAFVAMGLFFSSLTRNQIVAQLITFAAMIVLTIPYFVLFAYEQRRALSSGMMKLLEYTSYLYQMRQMVEGKVHLIYIVLHVGFTIIWLFLTVKVIEARKWK